ncbi:MAG: non-homologous end-joining DNA ligase [Acidimicrobiales bacterium]|nr:non-homologous end-joining DNA ligase [Acidimicrobiales bacterium]
MSEATVIEVSGTEVPITHPDKVFFSARGDTKLDLVRYYLGVEEPFLETVRNRPVLLQRFPEGAGGKSFFQMRVPKSAPAWLTTTVVSTPNGTNSDALVAVDLAHLLWAVNQGCLGFHVWPNRVPNLEVADELRIDLDPSPGIDLPALKEAAVQVHELLDELGIAAFVKTSGSRGLHVYAALEPRWDSYEVRAAAVALARELERRHPHTITAQWWKEERGQRVFVDFNQNAPHKTVFGAWCVRPRVGAQVSTPIEWDELADVVPDELTIATVPARLVDRGNPWAGMYDHPQDLTPLLERSAHDLANGLMDAPWPPVYPKQPNEPPRVAPSRARQT